jgi:hypothetical protein
MLSKGRERRTSLFPSSSAKTSEKMRCLELFSGTGSVGKAFAELGWDVISVDNNPKTDATIHADILEWDPSTLTQSIDFVWASPPCTQYSIARTTAQTPRNLELADAIVQRTLALIAYFNPRCGWAMENPDTGLMKTRPFMQSIPVLGVVDYCQYGYPYRKRTRLWGKLHSFEPRPLCMKTTCLAVDPETLRHEFSAQRGPARKGPGQSRGFSQDQLYSIPPLLCLAIAVAAASSVAPAT